MISSRVLWVSAVVALSAAALVLALAGRGGSRAQPVPPDRQYVAKALCGVFEDTNMLGELVTVPLRTAINVHNPNETSTEVQKKAVMAPIESYPDGVPGAFRFQNITPDGAFEIDCPDIYQLLLPPAAPTPIEDPASPTPGPCDDGIDNGGDLLTDWQADPDCFVKGFVVIYASKDLDVVGVYNAQRVVDAGAPGVGHAIEVDTISSRPIDPTPIFNPSQYAAKFVCGRPAFPGTVANATVDGDYTTAINVHNPNSTTFTLRKKFVLARSELLPPEPPSAFQFKSVGPDGAFEVDCADVAAALGTSLPPECFAPPYPPLGPCLYKGWVVLYSDYELDVYGVYQTTDNVPIACGTPPCGGVGLKIDIEPVRRSSVPPPP